MKMGQKAPDFTALGQAHATSEDETARIDTVSPCLLPEIRHGRLILGQQPQHAAFDRSQDAHPTFEDRREYLVIVVEAAEDKTILG